MPKQMQYDCNHCEYSTTRKFNFERHEKSHTQSKPEIGTHEIGFNIAQESIQHTYPNEDYNVNNIQNQHNSQYGTGSTVIPIEDYREVVGIAHEWKKECEIKDNAIHARNEFLTGNNHKLQVEYMRNKMLDVENERLQEENKILELEKESLVEEGNNRVSAMGHDMGKLINKYENLKNEKKKEVQTLSNSNLDARSGCGYAKLDKTNNKAPTTFKIGSSSRIAPTSFYELNDGSRYYRGENELIDVGIRDICQRSKGIGGMLRSR